MFGGKIPSLTLQPVITCGKSFIWDVWQCFEFAFVAINYFWKTVGYLFTRSDEYIVPYIKQCSNVQGQIPTTLCSTYFLNKFWLFCNSAAMSDVESYHNIACGTKKIFLVNSDLIEVVNCRKSHCPIATFIRRWHNVDIAWICQRPKIIKFHVFLIYLSVVNSMDKKSVSL